ncbi:CPCC family cysteine-rich protein [Streptomyces sp. NPDC004096]|uniref:CPCC family cysteine-rich protein n=1 Tax=unclassified Streptomyces TaxID=2593676 RepID=UPI00339E2D13
MQAGERICTQPSRTARADEHDVDEVRGGPDHGLSLRQARRTFEAIGAGNEYRTRFVRAPRPEEHPDSGTPHGTGTLSSRP